MFEATFQCPLAIWLSLSCYFVFNAKGEENCCFRDFLYDDGSSRAGEAEEVEDGQMLLEKMEETKHVTYNYSQAAGQQ